MLQICTRHSALRSQFVFHVSDQIGNLYDLPEDPTAIECRVDYLLERDGFMCSSRGYEVSVHWVVSPASTNTYEHDPANNESIPRAPDSRGNMGKVLQGQENVWNFRTRFSWSRRWHHGLLNLCHTVPYSRAWQRGVHLETCDFKPEAVVGEHDPEPSVLSFRLRC